jgi:hypothetical protein
MHDLSFFQQVAHVEVPWGETTISVLIKSLDKSINIDIITYRRLSI